MAEAPEPLTRADETPHRPALDATPRARHCWCSTATISGWGGDIVVLRVAGEVDSQSLAVLDAALDEVLDRRPAHLIVDLTGLVFCSSRGITAVADAARNSVAAGTRYSMSGVPSLFARLWPHYWSGGGAPLLYRTTADAVLAAIVLQVDR